MDSGTVCLVMTDNSLTPPSMTSSNPHEYPVDRVLPSAQPRGNRAGRGWGDLTCQGGCRFCCTPTAFGLDYRTCGSSYLVPDYLFSPFFQCLLSCPVSLVYICAQEHDLTFGFSEMCIGCPQPTLWSPPEYCVSATCPSSTSQSLGQLQILFAMVLHFFQATDQIIK